MVPYRKKDVRKGIRFTIIVTGPSGTGKTSFVNSLLDENILPHRFGHSGEKTVGKTITYRALGSLTASELEKTFDPSLANQEPGIAITETSVEIIDEDDSKILLTVIDTPGFGDNIDNSICVSEICNFLEQQFDYVLAEETKVRRNPRFEDTRVHACLYFIEPTGHGLRELDVESMTRLSKYCNIIPIISRADSFTENELANFKRNVLQDIERFKIPVFQYQVDESETDPDIIEESRYLTSLQPFAIVTSDTEMVVDTKKTRVRKYPWGVVDINDTRVSDFPVLKNVLLGSQLQELKDITHDFLYEAYRTERLSNVSDLKNEFSDSMRDLKINSSEPPSMSNLAEITKSGGLPKFDIPKTRQSHQHQHQHQQHPELVEEEPESINGELSSNIRRGSFDSSRSEKSSASTVNRKNTISGSPNIEGSPQTSMHSGSLIVGGSQVQQPHIDPKKLRKISETVPYMLRHETIRSKQAKLEELERQSALELSRRAAELERKAKELKMRETMLRERLAKANGSGSLSLSNTADSKGASSIRSNVSENRKRETSYSVQTTTSEYEDTVEDNDGSAA